MSKKTLINPDKEFLIKYEFMPSKESEMRIAQAYEMVFDEIENMLQFQVLQSPQ